MYRILLHCLFPVLLLVNVSQAQDGPYLGGQIGYVRNGFNQLELGVNALFYGESDFKTKKKEPFPDYHYLHHIFGITAVLTGTSMHGNYYVRSRFGFSYLVCPGAAGGGLRISPAFEFNAHQDKRIGFDVGISMLGIHPFVGFYWPAGKTENPGISFFRFGIRFVFNTYFNELSMSDLTY